MKKKKTLLLAGLCAALIGSANAQEKPTVQFIATGGTIAMKIDPIKKAPVPAISGDDLLATVPEVAEYAKIEVDNLSNVPSDYMD
ncbi:MAG: asparaginase, partial [Betaproteobacteria bacterium]|nr:asparaginase [Betaproteobacteria bacterium]